MEGVAIPFVDVAGNSFIECYADSVATVGGVEYTIGVPCDYSVALCYFDESEQLVPVELDDQELMDDIFPMAEAIVAEEFGEELSLQRTPQTLTLVGELEEDDDDDDMNDDEDGDDEMGMDSDDDDDDEEEEDAPLDPTLLRDLIEACNQAILKGEQQPHDATRINQKEDEHASILGDTLTHRHHDNGEESLPGRQEELLESTEEEEVKEDHLASAYDPIANERDQSATTPATATDAIAKATNLGLTTTRNSDVQPMDKEVELAQAAAAAAIAGESTAVVSSSPDNAKQPTAAAPKKKRRSIWFGAMMGAVVACWVFSGNYVFTGLFSLMTVLGQLEYYRMVINTGVYPARRISVVGACSMFWTALFCPQHHQIVLPLFGLWAMIWFLTMKRTATTIPEIATTFTGMFYLGYVPSFWVRIRLLGAGREPTRLAPLLGPILNLLHIKAENLLPAAIYPKTIHLPITTGAIFIFWTWLCLAFNDVFAYFVGKNMGRIKLGQISPAAGATSPNKTVEGVLGGCAVSAALGMLGAWVQKWPYWALTGMVHGTLLGLIGLIGDLTASMIKRDAGIKDFGDLIPEHGGILDRVDGFIWTAPYSWFVCHTVIPALKNAVR
mmetsp:Transcript_5829/g.16357  ORF Transcript_5829/g.16357 Transcript_5829/m.16357 type:complete len:613 (+) Transcript_5829:1462-3300(+)